MASWVLLKGYLDAAITAKGGCAQGSAACDTVAACVRPGLSCSSSGLCLVQHDSSMLACQRPSETWKTACMSPARTEGRALF